MNSNIREFIKAIQNANKKTTGAYDTTAKVLRVENGTAWVHIDGGAEETPVEMSVSCEPGDEVRVRLNKGAAYLIGNNTDPPTGMRVINTVKNTVKMAYVNIEELAKNVHDQFVLIGTSSINKLSDVMNHSSEGTNIYDDLSTVGNAYAHIDSDGLKIKRVANKDEIDDEEDSVDAVYAPRSVTHGSRIGNIGDLSFTFGEGNEASGSASFTTGKNNIASAEASVANGCATRAIAKYSFASGYGNVAEGESSIALGYGCHAKGERSVAMGYACQTGNSAICAVAEGDGSVANGQYSHAENWSTATGNGSHSQNLQTQAIGTGSHAGGLNTVAGYDYQTVIGKHNNNRSDTLFEVGNGGWSSGTDVRSNAFDVTSDGYLRTGQGDEKIAFGKVSGAYGWYAPPATQGGSATFYPWIILNNGKIPDTYLPSYVDDVIEGYYNSQDGKFYEDSAYTTEITGERGKIYVSLDTNTCYRWSGTVFVAITSGGVVYSAGTGIDIDANNEISVDGTEVALLADLADVATSGAYSDLSGTPNLATVATSGDYDDLINKPSIPAAQVNADWNATSGVAEILNKPTIPAAQVNSDWNASSGVAQILNKPTLATVATSGDYDDLINKPSIPAAQVNADWNATSGVAQILNKPTIPAAQVNSDWNATSGVAQILNKPTLATVATSGDYDDLINKPSIPAAQVNSDWNATSGVAQILNKPTLATVATSGSYNDLSNKPTIPARNIWYATCSTAADTAAKVATTSSGDFVLATGNMVRVKFTNANTFDGTATLSVDGKTAKNISPYGTNTTSRYFWNSGEVVDFVYDGSRFNMVEKRAATTTYYGPTKLATSAVSTNTSTALTPSSLNQFAQYLVTGYPPYDKTATYAVGDKVRYGFYSYKCTTAITTAEAWNAAHWTAIDPLQTQIDNLGSSIPSVGNGTLTIQKNGSNIQTFTANQSGNATANITVPTKTSELTNDSGYITSSALSNYIQKSNIAGLVKNDGTIDTNSYALASAIPTVPTNVSAFNNDAGYLTQHQSLANCLKNTGDTAYTSMQQAYGGIRIISQHKIAAGSYDNAPLVVRDSSGGSDATTAAGIGFHNSGNNGTFLYLPKGSQHLRMTYANQTTYETLAWLSDIPNVSNYLPLAGGTMTGGIVTPGDDSTVLRPAKNNYDYIGSSAYRYYRAYINGLYLGSGSSTAMTGVATSPSSSGTASLITSAGVYNAIQSISGAKLYRHDLTISQYPSSIKFTGFLGQTYYNNATIGAYDWFTNSRFYYFNTSPTPISAVSGLNNGIYGAHNGDPFKVDSRFISMRFCGNEIGGSVKAIGLMTFNYSSDIVFRDTVTEV